MKFILKSSSLSSGRTGIVSGVSGKSDFLVETPALMLYTRGGSVPHLTHEVLRLLSKENYILQTPLMTTQQMVGAVKAQGEGLLHFSGMNEHTSFMTFQDPIADVRLGKFETDKMPLWTRTGKTHFDANSYMDVVEVFKPDFYAVLSDSCTDENSSNKRICKSVDRSKQMLDTCVQRHINSEYLSKNSSILGVIVGGYKLQERKRFLNHLLEHSNDLDGFILDGIDYNGTLIYKKSFDSIKEIVTSITSALPENKLRVVQGCWNPLTLLDLVQQGWDVFDTTLPYLTTERGCCLTFNLDPLDKENLNVYEIDLAEKRFKDDMNPVLDKCECLCCRKHKKAYLHHLLTTRELLASVLIMMHNIHHYKKFFESIRQSVASHSMDKLRELIDLQYNIFLEQKPFEKEKINERQRRFSSDETKISNKDDNSA